GAAALAVGAALVGAGAGAGLGVGLGRIYDKRTAERFHDQIEKGGILVWVRCHDDQSESRAGEIMQRHGAHHVHAHTLRPT
ncbi:MAG TPA: hypothetical protein VLL76_06595, partial [Candidatus Omnitrophota bacterium]|nr:hypothetical protein [Candidatus Omnitrophota bacterium]